MTGLNTINNILKIAKLQVPLEAPIINIFTRMILTRELNMLFTHLRKEDLIIGQTEIEDYTEEVLDKMCFDRGINID